MSAVTKKIGVRVRVRVRDHDFLDVRVRVRVRGHGRTRLSADMGVRVHRSLAYTQHYYLMKHSAMMGV